MQGGTVILATSPFTIGFEENLSVDARETGLEDWLISHGLSIEKSMVMDPQNSAFPVPVQRQVGAFSVQETKMVNYPYFVDIRQNGMNLQSGLLGGLDQLTMNWASPITVDEKKNGNRQVTRLLESSADSWVTTAPELQPNFQLYGPDGFAPGRETERHLLGVVVEGQFNSYFADKESPLKAVEAEQEEAAGAEKETEKTQIIYRQLDKSPESARIILLSSSTFLSDTILSIGSNVRRTAYLGPVQMVENFVNWSLEDRGLLEIRGRSHFSRALYPMSRQLQLIWEYGNYGFALAGLFLLWLVRKFVTRRVEHNQLALLKRVLDGRE
jgi:ABC-2 type transport system permease protein